jgi:RimJ/RimL family protein N-acetyltransferase
MGGNHDDVTMRPVTDEDRPLLFILYASTRAEELALLPWDDAQRQAFLSMQFAAQQQHYNSYYPESEHMIILKGRLPVGRLWVDRRPDEIRILDITILPEHRGKGIGTPIIEALMREATEPIRPLTIYVENFNRSLGFFERLGFKKAGEHGINNLMQWHALMKQGG